MCASRTAAGTADFPRRLRRRPAGGDHQSAGHADARTDTRDEPQLHGVQVPTDQITPLAEGRS